MSAYGDSGPMSGYEYDHFVPLELGGAVNDARNLWPEPGASPNPKDAVEGELRAWVCDGQMTLAQAQRAITTDCAALAARPSPSGPSSPSSTHSTTPFGPSPACARCTVTASYNERYHDYDVHVRSNRPGETANVTDAVGARPPGTSMRAATPTCTSTRPQTPQARRSRRKSAARPARRRSDRSNRL
jgi:hypothetical protein